jgi:hypothetical protein
MFDTRRKVIVGRVRNERENKQRNKREREREREECGPVFQ